MSGNVLMYKHIPKVTGSAKPRDQQNKTKTDYYTNKTNQWLAPQQGNKQKQTSCGLHRKATGVDDSRFRTSLEDSTWSGHLHIGALKNKAWDVFGGGGGISF